MFKDLKNIIYDKDIKLILTDQKLDINNYTKIILVDDNKIILDNITLDDINNYKELLKHNDSSTLVIYPKEKSVN